MGRNASSSQDGQCCATQYRSRKRYGWPGTLANLDEATFRFHSSKFLAGHSVQQNFSGTAPQVIDNDAEALVSKFMSK